MLQCYSVTITVYQFILVHNGITSRCYMSVPTLKNLLTCQFDFCHSWMFLHHVENSGKENLVKKTKQKGQKTIKHKMWYLHWTSQTSWLMENFDFNWKWIYDHRYRILHDLGNVWLISHWLVWKRHFSKMNKQNSQKSTYKQGDKFSLVGGGIQSQRGPDYAAMRNQIKGRSLTIDTRVPTSLLKVKIRQVFAKIPFPSVKLDEKHTRWRRRRWRVCINNQSRVTQNFVQKWGPEPIKMVLALLWQQIQI